MTHVVRLQRHLTSETLDLPEAREFLGRDVEIVIREVEPADAALNRYPLRGSVLRFDDPFEPVAPDDWEAAE